MIEKLLKIQQELKVPKNRTNSFGGYKYRSCEDILEAVKPLAAQEGFYIIITDEVVDVGGRIYVKATAKLLDGKGTCYEASGLAREAETKKGMDEAQITGSASSYARKYALNGLFAIDDVTDADATHNPKEEKIASLDEALTHVSQSTSEADLTKRFKELSVTMQKDGEVIARCKELKTNFMNNVS